MPYLRMFLGEKQLDEVFISDVFVDSILGNHFLQEEKELMLHKHATAIKDTELNPSFDVFPPSARMRNFPLSP
jgi:hypothetical protein